MKAGRAAVAALVLGFVLSAAPSARAGNGSNYLHLINGLDYYFTHPGWPCGAPGGVWRCFPHEMLHSPTLVVDPASWAVGTYATKINAIHFTVTGGKQKRMNYPVIALSSGATHCKFMTSGGSLNWGLATAAGYGTFVVGPTGGGVVNLLALIGRVWFVNPASGPGYIVQVALNLTTLFGSPSSIAVPEGESLSLYIADDPSVCPPSKKQYWLGSLDERNLCSSYSFLWSGASGYVYSYVPWFEWSIGLGSIDATMTTVVQHDPAFDVGSSDAHSPAAGFNPGFDQGTGSQTLSLAGPAGLGDFLGFAVYDDPNRYGGTGRLACGNIWGYDLTAMGTCMKRPSNPSFYFFPTGGPGGPVLSTIWPQMPRCVGKIDTLFTALLANSIWILSTNHSTSPGGMNIPWYKGNNGQNSGSNASGVSGGFPIPVPQLPVLVGFELFWWNWATDGTNSFLDPNQNMGHALSNGYCTLFFP